MSLELLIEKYGTLAVFLGAGVEGETAVVIGGVLAHRGYLSFWQVAVAAAIGSFIADQFFFLAGRYARTSAMVKRMLANPAIASVQRLLERHPNGFVFAFRFIYGLRTISPIAIGTTQIPTARFVVLNALAACIWGPLFAGLGYVFGQGAEHLLGRLPLPHHLLLAAAVPCGLLFALAFVFRKRLVQLFRSAQGETSK